MTELATAAHGATRSDSRAISHWIGGRAVAGHVRPHRPRLQPGDGQQTGEVEFASRRGGRRRGRGREGGVPRLARDVALEARGAVLPDPRARPRAPRGDRADPHGRARQGALRRDGRGHARARGDRVRLRDPDAAEGRLLRAGLDRDRRLLDPPAARRRRRHHAVQLPRDGARCGCGRRRSRAATRSCSSRPRRIRPRRSAPPSCCKEAGRAGRRLQRRPRRQGRGRRAARAPGRRRGQLRRLDADRAATSTRRARSTASACRRSAARRTT